MRVRKDYAYRSVEESGVAAPGRTCPFCGTRDVLDAIMTNGFCYRCPCGGQWDVIWYINEGGRQRVTLEVCGR